MSETGLYQVHCKPISQLQFMKRSQHFAGTRGTYWGRMSELAPSKEGEGVKSRKDAT